MKKELEECCAVCNVHLVFEQTETWGIAYGSTVPQTHNSTYCPKCGIMYHIKGHFKKEKE
jgi:hypothetical protein